MITTPVTNEWIAQQIVAMSADIARLTNEVQELQRRQGETAQRVASMSGWAYIYRLKRIENAIDELSKSWEGSLRDPAVD